MDKILNFFGGLCKGKALETMGGMDGLLGKISGLAKNGNINLADLKKLVMPFAKNFAPGAVSKFFADNKEKTEMPESDVMSFFRDNMQQDAPKSATTHPAAPDVAHTTPAANPTPAK